ncbi:hypothetical protein N0B31_08135 [Salinirubellus salinus]|jgi:hypothetical protein|uniref:Uncharacterized protein n=1 Tax=Salinirubellus salinus TaxID=1364945 RepID=A0A9E7UCH5_9EURY|nr:hypothetical protein [Salinirubellus salinus]UWM56252.1 hypothetical protein N0B31_08135 [Salinirubellus salinus]
MPTPIYGGPDGEFHTGIELLKRTQDDSWGFLIGYEDRLVLSSPAGEERLYVEVPEHELPAGIHEENGVVVDERIV